MINLTFYLIQSGISLALLYALYWLFMRKDTFFGLQRVYLLLSVLLSILLPLFDIKLLFDKSQSEYFVILKTLEVAPDKLAVTIDKNLDIFQVLTIVYISGSIVFLLRFLFLTIKMGMLITRFGITKNNGLRFVFIRPGNAPFSFFNLIFISNGIIDQEPFDKIVKHELIHIRQKHSIDLLLLELLTILQWFNPFIWFYRHTLKTLHEFLADQGVLTNGVSKSEYQEMLVNQAFGIQLISLSNNFNHSLIKRRLIMMSKLKTNRYVLLKMVFVIPLAAVITILVSFSLTEKIVAQDKPDKAVIKGSQNELQNREDSIYIVVEKMPKFPGGDEARVKYMSENIRYPEMARKNGINGTVYITFIVEKDGKIANVKILRGIGGGCDEEAFRVIQNMPDWEPGQQKGEPVRTLFNIPIKFSLSDDSKKSQENTGTGNNKPPSPSDKK